MCDLISLFCSVDDFWKLFGQEWKKHLIDYGKPKKGPNPVPGTGGSTFPAM